VARVVSSFLFGLHNPSECRHHHVTKHLLNTKKIPFLILKDQAVSMNEHPHVFEEGVVPGERLKLLTESVPCGSTLVETSSVHFLAHFDERRVLLCDFLDSALLDSALSSPWGSICG
jgi:hypothetical protein